jgi:hypothetical protein
MAVTPVLVKLQSIMEVLSNSYAVAHNRLNFQLVINVASSLTLELFTIPLPMRLWFEMSLFATLYNIH